MDSPEFYKIECGHCGGGIEFPAHGSGEVILCPHCAEEVILWCANAEARPWRPDLKKQHPIGLAFQNALDVSISEKWRPTVIAALVAISCLSIALPAAMRFSERNFPLEDAYKTAPFVYNSGWASRLYGRILEDTTVASKPQMLDELLAISTSEEERVQEGIRLTREYMDNATREINNAFDTMPADLAKRYAEERSKTYWIPKHRQILEESKAFFAAKRAERHQLIQSGSAWEIKANTRFRVLDISGHYAKVRVLEGDNRGRLAFITPNLIRVK